jgi:hypothetical protein
MADKIIHLRSLTTGSIPTTSSFGTGQFAINVPDGRVFLRKSGSTEDKIISAITTDSNNIGNVSLSGSFNLTGSLGISGGITASSITVTNLYVPSMYQDSD